MHCQASELEVSHGVDKWLKKMEFRRFIVSLLMCLLFRYGGVCECYFSVDVEDETIVLCYDMSKKFNLMFDSF